MKRSVHLNKIGRKAKILPINLEDSKKGITFAAAFERYAHILKVDPLAQSVEHNTFNVGVLGSSPKRITEKERLSTSLFHLSY